jgi:hypothetical protein
MKTRTLNMLVDDKGRFVRRAAEHRFSEWKRVLVFVGVMVLTLATLEAVSWLAIASYRNHIDISITSAYRPAPPHSVDCRTFIAYDHNLYRACATDGR